MQYQPDYYEHNAFVTPASLDGIARDRAAALRAKAAILGFFQHARPESWPSGALCQQFAEYAAQFETGGSSVTRLADDLLDCQFAARFTPLECVEEALDEFFAATIKDADDALAEAGEVA